MLQIYFLPLIHGKINLKIIPLLTYFDRNLVEKDIEYIFVKQFRPGPRKDVIELVAGLLDNNGLTPMETMVKEIGEEIGYEVDHLVDMCNPFYTTPGKTNEKIHLFFASVSKKISNGGGLETENEDIEVIEIEKNDIPSLGIEDGKTLLALALYNIKSQI